MSYYLKLREFLEDITILVYTKPPQQRFKIDERDHRSSRRIRHFHSFIALCLLVRRSPIVPSVTLIPCVSIWPRNVLLAYYETRAIITAIIVIINHNHNHPSEGISGETIKE